MKYQVIARKFRPQLFEDVIGQKPIVQTLKNAIQMGRIGHAYLFSGPRGVGKTTTARLLAKGLNCVQGPTTSPCNACPSCTEVSAGQSIDVLEIDAASNTGVDNIRELRENARYSPSRDRHKIFIIDEVHMLSTSAFNALLKILEEPPPHVVFIMATTERHKLPATILSRCQQFIFRTIPAAEIHDHLKSIAERENVQIGEGALDYVVKAAEGSMRDAQSLLDQIISFSGQQVSDADVRDVLGFIPSDILDRTVDALVAQDSRELLVIVGIVVDQGFNLQQYVRELLSRVRDLLLMRLSLEDKVLGTTEDKKNLSNSCERFSEQELIRTFDLLLKLENELRWTSQPRFHLEVGMVKLAKVGHLRDIEDVIRDLKQAAVPVKGSSPTLSQTLAPTRPASTASPRAAAAPQPAREAPQPAAGPPQPPQPSARPQSFSEAFAARVEGKAATTAVYLLKADAIDTVDDRVEIVFASEALATVLEGVEHRRVLEEAATELLGKAVSVSLIIRSRQTGAGATRADGLNLRQTAEKEELVRSFLNVFKGDLAHVKPAGEPKRGKD